MQECLTHLLFHGARGDAVNSGDLADFQILEPIKIKNGLRPLAELLQGREHVRKSPLP